MLRLLLVLAVVVLLIVAAIGAALFHFFGWKGLFAAPVILIALVWVGKVLIKTFFMKFALGLFSMKSRALKGAAITIHSITPVNKPVEEPTEEVAEGRDESEPAEEPDEDNPEESFEPSEPEKPKQYFEVDLTISPSGKETIWEPGELILTSEKVTDLMKMEETDSVGTSHTVLVWNGSAFAPDEACKYPGEQRLLVTFEVEVGAANAWLQYYNVPLTEIRLPQGSPRSSAMIPLVTE